MALQPREIPEVKDIARQVFKEEIEAMDKLLEATSKKLETEIKDLETKVEELEAETMDLKAEIKKAVQTVSAHVEKSKPDKKSVFK